MLSTSFSENILMPKSRQWYIKSCFCLLLCFKWCWYKQR